MKINKVLFLSTSLLLASFLTGCQFFNQGLVPLRWGCALPSPNAPGKAPNHIHTTIRWGPSPRITCGGTAPARAR